MSASKLGQVAIKIPKRIERGPTDILKALASTIKHVPSEPEVSLIDDPYLLPRRPTDKHNFILSKLSGRKTARFLLNKHPELFYRDTSEPKIEAFITPEKFDSEMEFNESDLIWCIKEKDAENAIVAYKSLAEKGPEINNETLMQFLEMLCYTNEENILNNIENDITRYFNDPDKQLVDQTWKRSGIASKIFNKIKDDIDPPRAYSTMIAGLSKFNEHTAAKQVFDDFVSSHPDKGLYVAAYNGLLRSVPKLNSSAATAHQAIEEIVRHMEAKLVLPDLRIFNSILQCYSKFNCDDETSKKAFKLINDMKSLDIDPSLATHSFLLAIVVKQKGGARIHADVIQSILDNVLASENHIEIRDERDADFLANCMYLISMYLHNLSLAQRLHKIYLKNPKLFEHQFRKWSYLNNYFRLIITTDSLENILKFYDQYVPMHLKPNSDIYDALAEALDLYQADEATIKRIWKDVVDFNLFKHLKNDKIFKKDPEYEKAIKEFLDRQANRNNKR